MIDFLPFWLSWSNRIVVRRVVFRLLLFSRFPVGTGGGNWVTIGLFNVLLRLADVDVDKTSSIVLFSVLLTVFVGPSSSLDINLRQILENERMNLTIQQMLLVIIV